MGEARIKLGVIYGYSKGHIAIAYYLKNIIQCLNTLDDTKKPHVTIFCRKDEDFDRIAKMGYPYLSKELLETQGKFVIYVNHIFHRVFKRSLFGKTYEKDMIDVLFPGSDAGYFRHFKKLYWGGDFQDLYLPENFSKRVLLQRKLYRNRISYNNSNIVFSSYDSKQQYEDNFPNNNANKFVYRFSVVHPEFQKSNSARTFNKFSITKKYFIIPNQFWVHKNHKVVVQAAIDLYKTRNDFQIVFTGSEKGNNNLYTYAEELKTEVAKNDLSDNILFLGFIDRVDLLILIANSVALIQPSFFEGWNTSIEDAKSINKRVIASNLTVHKEQLEDKGLLFNPKISSELITLMEKMLNSEESSEMLFDYPSIIKGNGETFHNILRNLCQ